MRARGKKDEEEYGNKAHHTRRVRCVAEGVKWASCKMHARTCLNIWPLEKIWAELERKKKLIDLHIENL